MTEVLLFMLMLFLAYLFIPSSWFSSIFSSVQTPVVPPVAGTKITEAATKKMAVIPEDSVLKRHFLTHLRAEIEADLFPRPSDSILQRHYDAMVAAELKSRLASMMAA